MTAKDYIKLAKVMKDICPDSDLHDVSDATTRIVLITEWLLWVRMRDTLSKMLQEDNPRFDSDKFTTACGGTIPI